MLVFLTLGILTFHSNQYQGKTVLPSSLLNGVADSWSLPDNAIAGQGNLSTVGATIHRHSYDIHHFQFFVYLLLLLYDLSYGKRDINLSVTGKPDIQSITNLLGTIEKLEAEIDKLHQSQMVYENLLDKFNGIISVIYFTFWL